MSQDMQPRYNVLLLILGMIFGYCLLVVDCFHLEYLGYSEYSGYYYFHCLYYSLDCLYYSLDCLYYSLDCLGVGYYLLLVGQYLKFYQ